MKSSQPVPRRTVCKYKLKQYDRPKACVAKSGDNLELWHRRYGHLNLDSVKRLPSMVTGIDVRGNDIPACARCAEGKHHKLPFKSMGNRSSELLDLVHSDLCGPMEKPSIGGSKYFVTFIDDASRMTHVYFLKSKGEAFDAFVEFKAYVEKQTGRSIKRFRTDNGTEYVGNKFQQFLKASGIRHETSVAYNPQQNGLAERMNRTIEERARCLLFDSGLDKRFWAEATSTAVYLINRSPTKGKQVTPIEEFTGRKPDVANLRVFGSSAMAYVPKVNRKKWDPKSRSCVLVGYADCSKGYRVYDPATKQVFVSRDVVILSEDLKREHVEMNEDVDPTTVPFPVAAFEDNEEDCDPVVVQQSTALPPQLTRNVSQPTTRRSERERKVPGKYSDFKVTYSILPQNLALSQNRPDLARSSIIALPSHEKEEDVEPQHDSGHSDWERPVQGKWSM